MLVSTILEADKAGLTGQSIASNSWTVQNWQSEKNTLPSLPFLRLANFDILKSLNLPLRLGGIKQKNLSLILNVINLFVLFSLASGSKPLVTILLCWSCSGVGLAIHIINNENALKISRELF